MIDLIFRRRRNFWRSAIHYFCKTTTLISYSPNIYSEYVVRWHHMAYFHDTKEKYWSKTCCCHDYTIVLDSHVCISTRKYTNCELHKSYWFVDARRDCFRILRPIWIHCTLVVRNIFNFYDISSIFFYYKSGWIQKK